MKILAAIDGSDVSASVVDVAGRVATLLGADVEPVEVAREPSPAANRIARERGLRLRTLHGPEVEALRTAAQAPDAAALVVGARGLPHGRRPAGHVTQALMTSLVGALVIVPPTMRAAPPLRRILLALDGSEQTAAALRPVSRAALDAGVRVVAVHVLDPRAAPAFADQPHHWSEAFLREFGARHAESADVEVELRAGDPPERLLDAAKQLDADLVALAWNQVLDAGRAPVVRNAVAEGEIPVLLVPVTPMSHPDRVGTSPQP